MSLTGRLEDLGLSDILQIIGLGKRSGTLYLDFEGHRAVILFKQGLVVGAATDGEDDIGEDLLQAGLISEEALQISRKVMKQLPDRTLGSILMDLGYLDTGQLEAITKKRIERLIYRLLLVKEGSFSFEPDVFKEDEPILRGEWFLKKGVAPEYLLMECARIYDETTHYGRVLEEEFPEEQSFYEDDTFPKDISALRSIVQELRFPESISEIFLLILRFASSIYQRGVIFLLHGETLEGFGQFGLQIEDADKKIKDTVIHIRESPFLSRIIRSGRLYRGELIDDPQTRHFIEVSGGEWPEEVVIGPIVADGKVIAILYCDNIPENEPILDTTGLEIFLNQAGMAIEKAILKKKLMEKGNSKPTGGTE